MFGVRWRAATTAALLAAVWLMPGGFAGAVLPGIDRPATSGERAVRGNRVATTAYGLPVVDVERASWGDTHSGYPATDVFVGCGAVIVSPVDGVALEVRRVDSWVRSVDDPATRGGRSVTILGDDGVRSYLAHFDTIDDGVEVGARVAVGDRLGTMGSTGRSSACHLHLGFSPPCPGKEWRVRRGVVWPHPYLDAWRRGEQLSPVDEIEAWAAAHPDACADAMADPTAANS